MSIRISGDTIHVEGPAQVADAEPLLSALLENPSRTVDLTGAAHLHSAVIQLLLMLRPHRTGNPNDPFYVSQIVPLLDAGQG